MDQPTQAATGQTGTLGGIVHRFLPARAGGASLTLLLLHGTGGDESGMLPLGSEVAPAAARLSALGDRRSDEGMTQFCNCPARTPEEREALQEQVDALSDFVGLAADRYGFDARRTVVMGYSNGAAMAAAMLLLPPRQPGAVRLAGALIFRPLVPVEPTHLPDLAGIPVFIAGGTEDKLTPPEQAERLARMLRAAGADVTLRWRQTGHRINREELLAAAEWVSRRWPVPARP